MPPRPDAVARGQRRAETRRSQGGIAVGIGEARAFVREKTLGGAAFGSGA